MSRGRPAQPSTGCSHGGKRRAKKPTKRTNVLKHQTKHRTIKAALLTATIAGVCATGAVAPSFAADQGDFGAAYARGSHSHLRHARHLAGRAHHGGAQLTYFYRGG